MIKHIQNVQEFNEEINNNKCFVDFYATWCGPCKMISPIIEELDEKGSFGDMHVLKIDVDECPDIARSFGIQAIPCLMVFENGQMKKSKLGYMNENEILAYIK